MRRLFLLFVVLVATTALWAHDFEVNGIYYNYLDETSVEVTYKGSNYAVYSNEYSGELAIPEIVTYNSLTYSVTSIGEEAFRACSSLNSLTISKNVTSIGKSAFNSCSSLKSFTIPGNIVYIGESAFEDCTNLTSIVIPNSITSIENYTFRSCSSLKDITIPSTVTKIGCQALAFTLWEAQQPDGVVYINDVLYEYKGDMKRNTSVEVKSGTISISPHAFFSCTNLIAITIPNSVTSIGKWAFKDCSDLASIVIPEGIIHIEEEIFSLCVSLESITIPEGVKSIGTDAFYACYALKIITIPNTIERIGNNAFLSCKNLTDVYVNAVNVPDLGTIVFSSQPTCHIPCGTLEAYQASDWANIVSEFVEECEEEQYTRDVTPNRYGTICLPFGSTDFSGATFYEIAYKAPFMIYFDEVTKLEAGKPYIFYAHSNKLIVKSDGSRVNNPLFDNGLYGTFDEIMAASINILTNNYIVNNNSLCMCGEYCSLPANRAYVKLEEVSSTAREIAPERKRVSLSVQGENTTTALDNISEDTENIPTKEGVYDILGRKMSEPISRGFYIINGQKVIISQ